MILRHFVFLPLVAALTAGLVTGPATAPADAARADAAPSTVSVAPVLCDYVPETGLDRRFGGFYTNFWTDGIVPYVFEEGSTAVVRADTLTDVSFTIPFDGPRLTSPTGFPRFFEVGEVLRVDGSQKNDNRDLIIVERLSTGTSGVTDVLRVELLPGFTFSAEQPDGTPVIFFTTETVSELNQQRFVDATQEWEAVANVQFVPWTGQTNYVRVKNFTRNRVDGAGMANGENVLFMDAWWSRRTLVHELGHELGAKHEHQRPDRDDYVTVNLENVQPGREGNFTIDETMDVYPPTVYDFASIMHYFDTAFLDPDSTGVTIQVDPPFTAEWQNVIGTLNDLSFWDRKTMSFMYPESNWRFLDRSSSASTEDGGFRTPYQIFQDAYNGVPSGGRIIGSVPGSYQAPGVYDKRVTIEAPLGGVVIRGN